MRKLGDDGKMQTLPPRGSGIIGMDRRTTLSYSKKHAMNLLSTCRRLLAKVIENEVYMRSY